VSNIKTVKPNASWIITDNKDKDKLGSIVKTPQNRYEVRFNGLEKFYTKDKLVKSFGSQLFAPTPAKIQDANTNIVYDYPCDSTPYNKMFYVKHKLPIYTKERKSKSFYCAGHYLIRKKGWTEEFCPKLITLEKYKFHGPFATTNKAKAFAKQYL
tara:strand:+ start:245 stop:709 length:465 start_codon:yes stop_codon:yes gene_type:complete